MTEVSVRVPTELKSLARRTEGMLQRLVDVVGEQDLPRLVEYAESDPQQLAELLRMLVRNI